MADIREDFAGIKEVEWKEPSVLSAHQALALHEAGLPQLYDRQLEATVRYALPPVDAPSEILRNDLLFLSSGEVDRTWAKRIYIGLAGSQGDVIVQGFAHLRTEEMLRVLEKRKLYDDYEDYPIPPLIEAYIACPPHLRAESEECHVIEDHLAEHLFRDPYVKVAVTPYCRPHRLFAGLCAQAATHMCLVLCSRRFGASALGTFDIHRLACAGEGPFSLRTFGIRGLTLEHIANVFSSSSVGLDAIYQVLGVRETSIDPSEVLQGPLFGEREIGLGLMGLIGSNCPVILAVDNPEWVKADIKYLDSKSIAATEPIGAAHARRPKDAGSGAKREAYEDKHGLVLVGYRRENDRTQFIIHDSNQSAFMCADLHDLLKAASAYNQPGKNKQPRGVSRVYFVAAVPRGVRLSPIEAGIRARDEFFRLVGSADGRAEFLETAQYHLLPLAEITQEIVGALGMPMQQSPAVSEELADEDIRHLWRVQWTSPADKSRTTIFVDATRPFQTPGFVLTVDPKRGVTLARPKGGEDSWRLPHG